MRIAGARNDSLHNASSTISKNHAVVCIENAKRRDISRPASATSEAPGKKVRARSRWNSSLLDRGWFEFRRQLEDKLAWLAPCISKGAGPARFACAVSGAVMPPAAEIHRGNCSEAYAHASVLVESSVFKPGRISMISS